jgi:cation diffusion facilitator family transporter
VIGSCSSKLGKANIITMAKLSFVCGLLLCCSLTEGLSLTSPSIARLMPRSPTGLSKNNRVFRQEHTRRKVKKSVMFMHMGHSHGHHDHHVQSSDANFLSSLFNINKKRRRAALLFFSALAILGPPVVRNRALSRTDVAAFLATFIVVSLSDRIRRELLYTIRKMRDFRDGIVKHSPPPASPGKTFQYLFRNKNAADRVTLMGGVINLVLSVGKYMVGVTCHSSALIADAGHSLSDLFSDFVTLWAVQVARLPPDDDHPYGHGKFEAIGSLFLALTLLGTGISIGAASNRQLMDIVALQRSQGLAAAASLAVQTPTRTALLMAGISIVSKEWLYRITKQVGEKINSQVVIANAWHHRSDAYSSVLALFAIALAMFFPSLIAADAAAGILVAGMICMTGAEILGESIKQLTDHKHVTLVENVETLAKQLGDDVEVERVSGRQLGSSAVVDVAIAIPGDLSESTSRMVEERLRANIIEETDEVVDAKVHSRSKEGLSRESGIEHDVRTTILSNPDVNSVEGVTVCYSDSMNASVDVVIRVDPDATVAAAGTLAVTLRDSVEKLTSIDQASIFLDLNTLQESKPALPATKKG